MAKSSKIDFSKFNIIKSLGPQKNLISVIAAFVLLFTYGCMLLMIGYTSSGLASTAYPGSNPAFGSQWSIAYAIPQSIGLIVSTFTLKFLLNRFNVRWIVTIAFLVAAIVVGVNSVIDKIDNHNIEFYLFVVLNFFFGIAIGYSSPIASTYLGSIFTGKKRTTILSLSNGIYGVGAGILPLAFASIISSASSKTDFGEIRYFYFIAIGFSLFTAFIGLFLNYRHSKAKLSAKLKDEEDVSKNSEEKNTGIQSKQFSIFIPLLLMVVCMGIYMFAETIANYGLSNLVVKSNFATYNNVHFKIIATEIVGLFFFVQGLVRCGTGLTITRWIKNKSFIMGSTCIFILGFIVLATGVLHSNIYLGFLVAVLFGFGIGNLWPMIYSYAVGLDSRRSSLIGIWINIISMIMIPITQVIATLLIFNTKSSSNWGYITLSLLGVVGGIALISFVLFVAFYLKTVLKITHEDEKEPSLFEEKVMVKLKS